MMHGNPVESLAKAFYSAQLIDMPDIEFEARDHSQGYEQSKTLPMIKKTRRPYESELEVSAMFLQSWSSTALGFGGIGGQAITSAYTVVISCLLTNTWAVYFSGRLAYKIHDPNPQFFLDASQMNLVEVSKAGRYQREK